MSKFTKRVISFLAITAMLLGMMPASTVARAEETKTTPGNSSENVVLTFSESFKVLNVPEKFTQGEMVLSVLDKTEKGKISVEKNSSSFGTKDDKMDFSYRLKTGGKSDGKTNALTLTVPSKGTLYIAVRNASSKNEMRNLVLKQDGKEIYNEVVSEENNVDKIFSYAVAEVVAGDVSIGYTGALNFYGFIFVPAAEESTTTPSATATPTVAPTDTPVPTATNTPEPTATPVEVGDDYTYDFRDGSIIPTDTDGKSDVAFGNLSVKASASATYAYNGAQHGVMFVPGNIISIKVSGPVTVKIGACKYSNTKSYTLVSADGTYSETKTWGDECGYVEFTYTGEATTLSFELGNGSTYISSIEVAKYEAPVVTNTPEPTATNTPEPTATNTPVPTATNTPVPTATNTPEPTATSTPVPTATDTPVPTEAAADDTKEDTSSRLVISFVTANPVDTEFVAGGLVLKLNNAGGKLVTEDNTAHFGTLDSKVTYTTRLKTQGKSNSTNGMTLTVPSAGTLYIAVRTGKAAEAREVVLTQNGKQIYSHAVIDSEAVTNAKNEVIFAYQVVEITEAGDITIEYTKNSVNFYAFEFVPAESASQPTTTPVPIVEPTAVPTAEATATPVPTATNTPVPTATSTPTPTEEPDEEPVPTQKPAYEDAGSDTFDVANIDTTIIEGIKDKLVVAEGTVFDNFVKVIGTANMYRYNATDKVITSIETGKKATGKLGFTLTDVATVIFTISSNGDANTSDFVLMDSAGNKIENFEKATTVSAAVMKEFTYYNLPAGEYTFFSPEDGANTGRGVRVSKIVATYGEVEVPTPTATPEPTATSTPVPTATSTPTPEVTNTPEPTATNAPAQNTVSFNVANIDATKIEGIVDKLNVTEGTILDNFVVAIGGKNMYRYNAKTGITSIETGKQETGKLGFTLDGPATVIFTISSNGGSNTSDFVLVDKNGVVYKNTADANTIAGSTMTEFIYTDLPAGDYEFYSPKDGANTGRGVRVSKIDVTYDASEDADPTNGSKFGSTTYYDFQTAGEFKYTKDALLDGTFDFADGLLSITSAGKAFYENKTTGIRLGLNDTISIKVSGNSYISLLLPADSAKSEGKWTATCEHPLGKIECISTSNATSSSGIAGLSCVFKYTGKETTITFKVSDITTETGLAGILGVIVNNQPKKANQNVGNGKVDVFDFGAEALDEEKYNNMLTADIINAFYPGVDAGTKGKALPGFTTADLIFSAGGNTNNRLRSSNTAITRYDDKTLAIKNEAGEVVTTYTGYVYSNSSTNASVFIGIVLNPGDKLTIIASSNGNDSTVVCEAPDGSQQSYTTKGSAATEMTFYATEYGIYRLYSTNEKLVVARMEREHADAVTVNGTVDGKRVPAGEYTIVYTNDLTGAKTEVKPVDQKYTVVLRKGYTYTVSIVDANGFVVAADSASYTATEDKDETVNVEMVNTVVISGTITGLTAEAIKKLSIKLVNTDNLFVPEVVINAENNTFTVEVEKDVEYAIVAEGVNDYSVSGTTTAKATEDMSQDITFEAKTTYKVNLTTSGISDAAWANAVITFTNLNEAGYVYSFKSTDAIALRDGTYSVKVSGVGTEVAQKLTANAIVNGADAELKISFETLTLWNPAKLNKEFGGAGIETIGEGKYYAGLVLAGNVIENKTYLLVNADATVKIPVKQGQMVTVSYCYSAGFTVDGLETAIDEKSGSTSKIDKISVIAKEDGYVTLTGITGTNSKQTYITSIEVADVIAYAAEVTVGKDKQFQTINAALDYVAKMERTADQRVTIVIDPGNYEEMLVINIPNVTLKNAAGENSSTDLTNKGVDIAENAVRITSYYLHGYYYYSMGSDCKYDAELLEVNKANGEYSFKNPGSGTTNGSYWNATVVITASGFEADGIIFENSANQYISLKESQDIVVAGTGNKGVRPTTYGDTSVQNKSFVERAAALAIANNLSEIKFTNCRFVGRQDTLYGGTGVTAAFDRCQVMGACDFIFGGMTAVFYKCDLVLNTSDASSDVAYITAAQQTTGRGYLMYECHITSTTPGVDTASKYASKPGYFGRPWAANTAEVVFYNTVIDASDDYYGQDSLIHPNGWLSTLSGTSENCYEFGTKEQAFYDNKNYRVKWSNVIDTPTLKDGTDISTEEKAISAFLGDWKAFN